MTNLLKNIRGVTLIGLLCLSGAYAAEQATQTLHTNQTHNDSKIKDTTKNHQTENEHHNKHDDEWDDEHDDDKYDNHSNEHHKHH